jgi:hypothetical protein
MDVCAQLAPVPVAIDDSHSVSCHLYAETGADQQQVPA